MGNYSFTNGQARSRRGNEAEGGVGGPRSSSFRQRLASVTKTKTPAFITNAGVSCYRSNAIERLISLSLLRSSKPSKLSFHPFRRERTWRRAFPIYCRCYRGN